MRLRFLRYSLRNKNLLDTHLDLLDTDFTSKIFVCRRDVLKMSSRYVFKTSSRRLQDVFSVPIFRLPRCLQDALQEVLKKSSSSLQDVFIRCLQDVLKTSSRRLRNRKIATLEDQQMFAGVVLLKVRMNNPLTP